MSYNNYVFSNWMCIWMKIKKWVPVVVFLLLTVLAGAALADGGYVAQIGSTKYETLDAAVAAVVDGATIELLADCVCKNGLTVSNKSLTIDGKNHTITLNGKGIYACSKKGNPEGKYLKFQNGTIEICANTNPSGSGATADLISNFNLIFDNTNVTISRSGENNCSGIYLYQKSNLYIKNKTAMEVSGFNGSHASGIYADNSEYDDADNREIKVLNQSSLIIKDCDWHGMTINPIDVTIDGQSSICISDCGNSEYGGGLGCYYGKLTITNESTLNTSDNRGSAWGAFVKELDVDKSSILSSCRNAGWGIAIGGDALISSGATLTLDDNKATGLVSYAGSDYWYGDVTIMDGASVSIQRNSRGVQVMSGAKLNLETGSVNENGTNLRYPNGGGIIVFSGGSAIIGSNVDLYNNHASNAGDDIYSSGQITFGKTGSGWRLDGEPDCTDAITGWFDDAKDARWEAHASDDKNHIVLVDAGAYEAPLALKAAHGILPAPTAVPTAAPVPKTGDNTPLYALYALLALSLSAALVLTLRRKAHR